MLILSELQDKSDSGHIHDEYITEKEADVFIKESVSVAIDEILGAGAIDAGRIIERS